MGILLRGLLEDLLFRVQAIVHPINLLRRTHLPPLPIFTRNLVSQVILRLDKHPNY